jgi:membrane protein implicated in regulation of membrane protease activity
VLAFIAFVLASLRFIGSKWSSAGLVFVAVSLVSTLAWFGYRRWRHRRRKVAVSA